MILLTSAVNKGNDFVILPFLANYPESVVDQLPSKFECGVYYGCARVDNGPVHKMVMSVGWNPQYKNEKKSMVNK